MIFFDRKLHFKALDSSTITRWLQQRHDTTGFTASFTTVDKEPVISTNGWLPASHQTAISRGSKGNIKTACSLWLKSIHSAESKHIVAVPPTVFDESILNSMSEEDLYLLCSLLFHKEISLEYLSEDMNLTQLETRMRIDFLQNKDIVKIALKTATYSISATALTAVLSILAKKNLINMEELGGY